MNIKKLEEEADRDARNLQRQSDRPAIVKSKEVSIRYNPSLGYAQENAITEALRRHEQQMQKLNEDRLSERQVFTH